jgi:tetratricopeptide (TPR) repeat protein
VLAYRQARLQVASLLQERLLVRQDSDWLIEHKAATAQVLNNRAWELVTGPADQRPSRVALRLARQAVEQDGGGGYCITLGWAAYRMGKWKQALEAGERALPVRNGGDCADWFLLAMVHWRLGDKEKARQWYDKANRLMLTRHHDDWPHFRAEVAALLGLNDQPPGMKRQLSLEGRGCSRHFPSLASSFFASFAAGEVGQRLSTS